MGTDLNLSHQKKVFPQETCLMWENRCKVAISGVGFSDITRSAQVPLAAHALHAARAAVEDAGLEMSNIDGLATYPA